MPDAVVGFLQADEATVDQPQDTASALDQALTYARELSALYGSTRAQARRLRLLAETSSSLMQLREMDSLLALSLERALTIASCDGGCVLRAEPEGGLSVALNASSCAISPEDLADGAFLAELKQCLTAAEPRRLAPTSHARVMVPLVLGGGEAFGLLLLEAADPTREFSNDELEVLRLLALQVAAAIDSTRLHAQLANREEQLQDLVGRLLLAQEEERRHLALEVHDGLAQLAAGTYQHIEAYAASVSPAAAANNAQLDRARQLGQQTVREARRLIAGLRPTSLDDFGLATAIRLEVEGLRSDGWTVSYDELLGGARLPQAVETAMFRVCQEALRNVRKHAGLSRVHVSLIRRANRLKLEVRDWGSGFYPDHVGPSGPGEHVGLPGMRERLALLDGSVAIVSQPGAGTRVTAEVPLAEPTPSA